MMETLVAVAQHRNQYYVRDVNQRGQPKFEIGSPLPSQSFRDLSCRTFQSGVGLLPTPTNETPGSGLKTISQSTPITIPVKVRNIEKDEGVIRDELLNRRVCYSELWAGPAYSNSPPPSSLPIPKFSLRSKRTTSLDLPDSAMAIDGFSVRLAAKSAPSSPTLQSAKSPVKPAILEYTISFSAVEVVPVSCSFLEDIDPVVPIVRSSIKVRDEAYFCQSDCLPMLARKLCGIPAPYCLLFGVLSMFSLGHQSCLLVMVWEKGSCFSLSSCAELVMLANMPSPLQQLPDHGNGGIRRMLFTPFG
ncbi:hypothetical protein MLD38_039987 [Melastoma candidum]|uniref:Uncharacterized protein n=1 Tax=Melastoma candidum TaxID=119954 RepID=A0ACB9L4A3_9MYRT|nr:hypothetical protein MLD38_039987 [Melastoma candidum]